MIRRAAPLLLLLSLAQAEEEMGFETIRCPIASISEDGREAVLAYGSAEGIVEGTRGEVHSRSDDETKRRCVQIGNADVFAVEEHSARARLTFLGEDRGREKDVVVLTARVP